METGNYYELLIQMGDNPLREILIARLADMGYEGFEESGDHLKAYIAEEQFSESYLNDLFSLHPFTYSKSIIKRQNWNHFWESNFEPVEVDNFVGIRAAFHPPFAGVTHEIIITPKMSFGTGHHATTSMMIQLMREISFTGRAVFDFGTGTGILAILAEKLRAGSVLAVDNDDWCIENASENILINHCINIDIQKVDTVIDNQKFGIILANINKNVLLENMGLLNDALLAGGQLLLSGLLEADEKDIFSVCCSLGLQHTKTIAKNGWIAIGFNRI